MPARVVSPVLSFSFVFRLQHAKASCRVAESGRRCITCYMAHLTSELHARKAGGKPYAAKQLADNCGRWLSRTLRPGRQEDAHEFLRALLYGMAKDALVPGCGVKEGDKERRDETSAVHGIFGGYLQNTTHCPKCGFDSNRYDAFLDLSLEVGGPVHSVEDALKHFTAAETLDADNKWKCPRCATPVCASKRLAICKVGLCTVAWRDARQVACAT